MEYTLRFQVQQEKIQLLPNDLKIKGVRVINQGIDAVKSTPYYVAERINRVHALDGVSLPTMSIINNPAIEVPLSLINSLKEEIKIGLKRIFRFSLYAVVFIIWFLCTYYN